MPRYRDDSLNGRSQPASEDYKVERTKDSSRMDICNLHSQNNGMKRVNVDRTVAHAMEDKRERGGGGRGRRKRR